MEMTMHIQGMMCPHCEATVKKVLEAFPAVTEAVVSHQTGTAVLTLCEEADQEVMKQAVVDAGYTVQ